MSRRTVLASVLAAFTAACSRAAFLAVNVPASFGPYRRHLDAAYGEDPRQRLDWYVPNRVRGDAPLVVFWHGGRWEEGDKADYRFVGAALAQAGYVVAVPNYRHYPQVKMPGFMDDAARAAAFAQQHAHAYGANPQLLFLMGHSAGAHIAALLALDPRYLAAHGAPAIAGLVGLSGPYDFLPLREADVQDMFGPPPLYPDSQPIRYARADAPAALLIHGLSDDTVWPKNSRNLATALQACGAAATLKLYPNTAHADTVAALSIPVRHRAPTLADITGFIAARSASREFS